ncbi:MAG TPA: branched-chain amino acid ABC transporter permease/ATP-binding protein [Iamia sp.]|nr:branched-chain amino acid ABC transporter permease/ATP-binding protein [Iamia sp.]
MIATWVTQQLVFDGVVNGLVIGLIALGVVLVDRASRVINFAVGSMGVVGASVLALLVLSWDVPFWVAVALVLLLGAAYGAVVELAVVRRLFAAPRVIVLVATIGVAGLSTAITRSLPRPDVAVGARYPLAVGRTWDDVLGVRVSGAQVSILVVVPVVAVALAWFLNRTLAGKAVLASADNPRLARTNGVNPKWVSTFAWTVAGVLSTVSIVLASGQSGSITGLADLGPATMVRALAAFLIAGRRSFPRALGAGVALGVVEALIRFNFLTEPGLVDLVLFVVVLGAVWAQTRRDPEVEGGRFSFATSATPVPPRLADVWWARNLSGLVVGAVLLVAALVPLVVTTPSRVQLYTIILAFAICGTSLVVLTGWGGQPSLGQMAYAGVGALSAAALARGVRVEVHQGDDLLILELARVPFALAVLLGAVVAAVAAALVGLGALRVRGMLLGVSTFAFAIVASQYLYRRPILSGGASGSTAFPRGTLLGLDLGSPRTYYLVVLAVLALVVVVLARVRRSGVGRTILAVRDNPRSAAASTLSPSRATVRTFALAGGLAGLGGGLLAGAVSSVPFSERFFTVQDSLTLVGIVVIGGLGSLVGPLLGSLWVVGLPAFFPDNDVLPLFASNVGLLVLLLYLPGGFVDAAQRARTALLAWAESRLGPEPAAPPPPPVRTVPGTVRTAPAEVDPDADLLRVEDLAVSFGGIRAVDGVTLALRPGEVLGLIGANGAGKSTLMDAVGGFVPASGRVTLLGEDVTGTRPETRARRGLGRTFQAALLFPELTVRETLLVALESAGRSSLLATAVAWPGATRRERARRSEADELIAFCGLGRYADRQIVELSTGTRRIVELACLLALRARVLCMDEPTAGVAQRETEALGPLVLQVREELDAGLIVIEHDMPFIVGISDRLVCLEAGKVIADGTPDAVRSDPRVVASYLGTDARAITRSGP